VRKSLISSLLFCVLMVFFAVNVSAQDFEVTAGPVFTVFMDAEVEEEHNTAFGFYVGGKYEVLENLKIGGQFERFSSSETETEEGITTTGTLTVNGIVGLASYDLLRDEDIGLSLKGGPGFYFGSSSAEVNGFTMSFDLEGALGFKGGCGFSYALTPDLDATGNVFYRFLRTSVEDFGDEVNLSGIEVSAGIDYSF